LGKLAIFSVIFNRQLSLEPTQRTQSQNARHGVQEVMLTKTVASIGFLKSPAFHGLKPKLLLTFLVLAALVGRSSAQKPITPIDSLTSFTAYLDGHIPQMLKKYDIPGVSMAIVNQGELVWSGAYGLADIESQRPMTVDSICRVESISKSVTAWGVMHLVEQGLIDLDAPIQQYLDDWQLPDSGFNSEGVTVRRLLSASAGMPLGTIGEAVEYVPQSEMPSLPDFLTAEARLIQEPGTAFMYSDTGFNLLELLIEKVTARDFAAYMADEILTPLGMSQASFEWNAVIASSLPMGYDLHSEPVPPYVYPAQASGGLFANVEDIAHFVNAGMTEKYYQDHGVLIQESIRTIHTHQIPIPGMFGVVAESYGFGHFIETLPDGKKAVWHGGQGHGWMTHFHVVPESGNGIVILTNSQRSWPFIAEVLQDWAKWSGHGSPKFSRINQATVAFQILVGLTAFGSFWIGYRLACDLRSGDRKFAPFSCDFLQQRLLKATVGSGLIAGLGWSIAQPYLFITSIFPGKAAWAGFSTFIFAILLILSTLFPRGVKNAPPY
jgi:CubicO group peptidase (beta-lactamase class C family)